MGRTANTVYYAHVSTFPNMVSISYRNNIMDHNKVPFLALMSLIHFHHVASAPGISTRLSLLQW